MTKYSHEFKIQVLEYYRKYGVAATVLKHNVATTTIYKWEHLYETYGVKGFDRKQNKKYSVEEKLKIIDYYRMNGKTATIKKYDISDSLVMNWERILLEYGEDALGKDRRGRSTKGKPKNDVNQNEDLLAEVQRLRMENAYLKKLDALVQKRGEKQKKKK